MVEMEVSSPIIAYNYYFTSFLNFFFAILLYIFIFYQKSDFFYLSFFLLVFYSHLPLR